MVPFLRMIWKVNAFPENIVTVAADAKGLYPSILHHADLGKLKETIDIRSVKHISIKN